MPTLKAVKNRIASAGKIRKISNALEMVALTRLKHMQTKAVNARVYFEKIRELVFDVAQNVNYKFHPFLEKKESVNSVGIIAIFSDKGLCGNFNANVATKLFAFTSELKDKKVEIAAIGKKGARYLKKKTIYEAQNTDPVSAARPFIEQFLNGKIGEIYLLYSKFRLHLLGGAAIMKLLPFAVDDGLQEKKAYSRDYIYEPNAYEVFGNLAEEYIENQVYHGMLESKCAEEMSRMLAMKSASENADEMIGKLNLVYHKARQAAITRELTEVIAAAEAA